MLLQTDRGDLIMRRTVVLLASLAAVAALPAAASAAERPPVHCDPMACPDPVGGIQDCIATLALSKDENGNPVITGDCSTRDIVWGRRTAARPLPDLPIYCDPASCTERIERCTREAVIQHDEQGRPELHVCGTIIGLP